MSNTLCSALFEPWSETSSDGFRDYQRKLTIRLMPSLSFVCNFKSESTTAHRLRIEPKVQLHRRIQIREQFKMLQSYLQLRINRKKQLFRYSLRNCIQVECTTRLWELREEKRGKTKVQCAYLIVISR